MYLLANHVALKINTHSTAVIMGFPIGEHEILLMVLGTAFQYKSQALSINNTYKL